LEQGWSRDSLTVQIRQIETLEAELTESLKENGD
jgi:hypothetical protein